MNSQKYEREKKRQRKRPKPNEIRHGQDLRIVFVRFRLLRVKRVYAGLHQHIRQDEVLETSRPPVPKKMHVFGKILVSLVLKVNRRNYAIR